MSEVLDVFSASPSDHQIVVSDDGIVRSRNLEAKMKIEMRDSIKSVEAFVGWLTRKKG